MYQNNVFRFSIFLSLIVLSIFGCFLVEERAQVSTGKIVRVDNFVSKFVSSRNIEVWLPEGYSEEKKYAVVYMHDGQALFDAKTTWNNQEWQVDEVAGQLLKEGKIRNSIVVGIWNSGHLRHTEYLPQKPFEALSEEQQETFLKAKRDNNQKVFVDKVNSNNYLAFLVWELKPYIDSHFSTYPDPENTFVVGSNMGGLISLYAICEFPDIFGGAACISTHWSGTFNTTNNPFPNAMMEYLNLHLPLPKDHKIYFDHGTESLDKVYAPYQARMDSMMVRKKYTSGNWITKVFEGADHSELAWQKRLDIPLQFLLREE